MKEYLRISGRCPVCHKVNKSKFKLCQKCRDKKREAFQAYRKNHPNKVKSYTKKRQKKLENIPWVRAIYTAKARAKRLNLQFDLTIDYLKSIWVDDGSLCPVLGIPMYSTSDTLDSIPSVDRIDPTRGYVQDNIRIISYRANTLKSNASSKELFLVYQDLLRIETKT